MARFLLSSRTLLDIIQRKGEPGELWLSAKVKQHQLIINDICISAIAPMAVPREIDRRIALTKSGQPDPHFSLDDLLKMRRNADAVFRDFAAKNRIVAMTAPIAERWGDLLDQEFEYVDPQGARYKIGSVQKLEIATAIVGRNHIPFAFVDRLQAVHAGIDGLTVEDPTVPIAAAP